MAVNKVVYNNNTLIDLTEDTVTADSLAQGLTAHDKSGAKITGSLRFNKYYTGTAEPTTSIGDDGDLYLMIQN